MPDNDRAAGISGWGSADHMYLHSEKVKGIFGDLPAKEWERHTGRDFASLG